MKMLQNYRFLKELQSLPFVEAIYLYGSRARGDATERSDIDLAIVCPQATEADRLKITDLLEEADTLLFIDVVRYDRLDSSDPLYQQIDQDKQVLYEQVTGTTVAGAI